MYDIRSHTLLNCLERVQNINWPLRITQRKPRYANVPLTYISVPER